MGKYQAGGLYGTNTQSLFRTYEPLNLKAHVPEAAKILRERYDTAVEEKSLLDRAMGSIRTISDADAAKVNVAKYDINNNIIGDRVDYENMGKTIKDAATRLLTDHSIMRAQDSFANYQKELEENAALTRQGIKILDFNQIPVKDEKGKIQKDSLGNPLMQHVSKTWDSDVNGVYQRGSQAKLDWDAQAQQLIQGIAADSGPIREALSDAKISPEEAKLWLSAGEGVSKDKIKRIAQALKPVSLQTQEGMQMFNYLTRLEIDPKEGDLHRPEVAEKKMEDFLYNIGLKQAGWTNRYMQSAIDRSAGSETPPFTFPTSVPGTLPTSALTELASVKNLEKAAKNASDPDSAFELIKRGWTGELNKGSSAMRKPKVEKLLKAYKEGTFNKLDFNSGEFTSTDLYDFASISPELNRIFPRLPGETEKQYNIRKASVFGKMSVPTEVKLEDQTKAAGLLMTSITRAGGGVLFQENGNPAGSLEDALYSMSTKTPGSDFWDKDSGVVSSLKKSLEWMTEGKRSNDEYPDIQAVDITQITTGPNAGRWRYVFNHDNSTYSVVAEAFKGQSEAYSGLKQLSDLRTNLVIGKEVIVNVGGEVMSAVNVPETTEKDSRIRTVVTRNKNGKLVLEYIENVEDELYFNYIQMLAGINSQVSSVYSNIAKPREKGQ